MRVRFLSLLLLALAPPLTQVLYPGCATLTGGTTQPVRVKSRPAGAEVYLNEKLVGKTPTTVAVSRWGWHRVKITMPGFEPYEVRLEKSFNLNAHGNVFIGGVWIVVDAATGAIFDLGVSPEAQRAMAKLPPEKGDPYTNVLGPSPVFISVELKPTPSARKIGQMKRS